MALVYRDFDQAALDFQYNNQAQVADPTRYLDWYVRTSADVRKRIAHTGDISYGALPDERLDIFTPSDPSEGALRPIVAFVHGGAWRNLNLACSSFAAETFTARGAVYVAIGFSRMPAAGTLDEMVAQVRTAVAWVWQNAAAYGGDQHRLHLLGHSSGSHLAAMALATDWPRLFGLPQGLVRSAALVSGIYDLEPVRLSYRNEMLRLDRAAEIRNSPCRNLPVDGAPSLIAYGGLESSEFKRQSRTFAEMWQRRFGNCREMEVEGRNHYEIVEGLIDPASQLTEAVCRWFGI